MFTSEHFMSLDVSDGKGAFVFKKIKVGLWVFILLFMVGNQEISFAGTIDKWVKEFQPSALTKQEQKNEFEWFAKAAKPYRGMEIKSCAEGIPTHKWEAAVLAKAFTEITGIKVSVDIIGEGEVVNRMTRQMETNEKTYDIYINDADLIGTHLRADSALDFKAYIKGEGKAVTNPRLDLPDFLNCEFGQDYEGHQLQIPDQQFANLYWFRHDWFSNPTYMAEFKKKYGYTLGVPLNWQAYEDIAEFFTGKTIDGKKGIRPHGLREKICRARVAIHRCLALHGRCRGQGAAQRPTGG